MISFHVRPATKDGLQTFIKTDAFLSSRGDSEHPGPCLFWYDASADLDVKVGTHKAANPFRTVVVPDIAWFRVFFEAAFNTYNPKVDMFGYNAGKGPGPRKETTTIFIKCPSTQKTVLNVVYRETDIYRGFKQTSDMFSFSFCACDYRLNASKPRLHFTLTSTMCDAIVMATPPCEQFAVPARLKRAIVGANGVDADIPEGEAVPLYSLETDEKVCAEIVHQVGCKIAVVATPGSAAFILACLDLDVKVIALVRNDAQKKALEDRIDSELEERGAKANCTAPYALSDRHIKNELGYANEEEEESEKEGDNAGIEALFSEEGEEGEGEGDNEEEEEEEDKEEDAAPPKKKPRKAAPKSKATPKKTPPPKGKATPKAAPKGRKKTSKEPAEGGDAGITRVL